MLLQNLSRVTPRLASRHVQRQVGVGKGVPTPATRAAMISWSPLRAPPSTLLLHRALGSLDESTFTAQKQPKQGTGFDNFTPRGSHKPSSSSDSEEAGKNEKDSSAEEPAKKEEKKDATDSADQNFSKDGKDGKQDNKDNGGRNNNNNTDPNRFENWIPAIVMLLITFYLSQRPGADEPPDSVTNSDREISWHDFLRLLQQQDVVKVVVTDDRQSARVYLKSNATGLARGGSGSVSFGSSTTSSSTYEEQRRKRAENREKGSAAVEEDQFHNQEQVDGLQSAVSGLQNVVGGAGGHRHPPFFYRMQIGSVETFERKLDEAQRALKRDPENDIPVQYLPDSVSFIHYPETILFIVVVNTRHFSPIHLVAPSNCHCFSR